LRHALANGARDGHRARARAALRVGPGGRGVGGVRGARVENRSIFTSGAAKQRRR
jgi:hypothetical protein